MKRRGTNPFLILWVVLLGALAGRAGTLVEFRTTLGDMVVELYDGDRPITVANFVRYVDAGRYTNVFFHRCIPGFVAQAGGYGVTNPLSASPMDFVQPVVKYDPITNEFGFGPRYSNVYGTIAMAKVAGNTNSATCEWFFNLADNSANLDHQNGGFTVFGRVLRGTNVLEQFNSRSLCNGITTNIGGVFGNLPITPLFVGCYWPPYNHLLYVDMKILSTDLSLTPDRTPSIEWKSISGMTNIVEYADSCVSSDWQPLASANGTGGMLSVTDSTGSAATRFYRVRME